MTVGLLSPALPLASNERKPDGDPAAGHRQDRILKGYVHWKAFGPPSPRHVSEFSCLLSGQLTRKTLQLGAAFFPGTPDRMDLDHALLLVVEVVDVAARLRHQHALDGL